MATMPLAEFTMAEYSAMWSAQISDLSSTSTSVCIGLMTVEAARRPAAKTTFTKFGFCQSNVNESHSPTGAPPPPSPSMVAAAPRPRP
eukprot:CAMPEP_0183563124 /NCGR_PEP_ID=MMETSP0371-20130417/100398_1 /TAXON_ID=268820 /ORGANISM="Peridinium aciculiferum, Strain PAER-2" /LENGTH=87 /DNA_ID=CAMNT_0025771925 /DNA_START=14 /DNA_END=273 /DNA_ORIENTATION=+